MTQKTNRVNEIIKRVDIGIDHIDYLEGILWGMISNQSNGLLQKARDILDTCRQELDTDALWESRRFLEDLKDDMIHEGGIDRDDLV
jgi:hypothetical protein